MGKRRTREQIQRLLREAERDLAKGLTVGDVCRKIGVSQTSYLYCPPCPLTSGQPEFTLHRRGGKRFVAL